jgi:signal recognition particle subunit SRP54
MAQRILGMGDVVALATEAIEKFDQEETERIQKKMMKGELTLDDFMAQMGQIKRLGPMNKVLGMIPGMGDLARAGSMAGPEMENMMSQMRAIYDSMTKQERRKPEMLDGARRRRVAAGSGTSPAEIGQFVKQFETMRGLTKSMAGAGLGGMKRMIGGLMGGGLAQMAQTGAPAVRPKGSSWQDKKDRNKKKRRR